MKVQIYFLCYQEFEAILNTLAPDEDVHICFTYGRKKKNWNGTTKKYKKEEKGQVGPLDCHHEKYDMKIKMMKSTG